MSLYRMRDLLAESLVALGGPKGAKPPRVSLCGREFTAQWFPGGKNTPSALAITVTAGSDPSANATPRDDGRAGYRDRPDTALRTEDLGPIIVRRETSTDRFGKRLGINREIQIGDEAFDSAFYIETQVPASLVKAALSNPDVRKAMRAIDAANAAIFTLYDGAALLTVRLVSPGESSLTPGALRTLFESIAALAAILPHDAPAPRAGSRTRAALTALFVSLTVIPLALAFAVIGKYTTFGSDAQIRGALVGLVVSIAILALVTLGVRGRSDALRIVGFTAMALWFGGVGTGILVVPWLNGVLDHARGIVRETTVVQRYEQRGKSTLYYVVLAGWRPAQGTVRLNVTPREYHWYSEGTRVHLTTHPGAFGWEWYDQFGPSPAE